MSAWVAAPHATTRKTASASRLAGTDTEIEEVVTRWILRCERRRPILVGAAHHMTTPHRPDTAYHITVPASPEQVGLARLFLAAVLRGTDLGDHTQETIEDAKLAVSELVTALISGGSAERIDVTAWRGPNAAFAVRPWVDPAEGDDFGPLSIVEALFPGTTVLDGEVFVPLEPGVDG
jgi:hypothetical protein